MVTLVLVFKKIENEDKTKYDNFYSSSKAEIIINESDVFQSVFTTVISNIKKSLGKSSGWFIDSVIDHTIIIQKHNPLAGSSYIKSRKELDNPRKGLINIRNIDNNECFKWCLVRYLNAEDPNPRKTTKSDEDFAKRLDYKDIKFPIKMKDIHKIQKTSSIITSVFGSEKKEKHAIYA